MVEQNIGVVLSGLAALFSYLAWVRMTTRSRTEIQETLSNYYSGAEFGVNGYIARIQNVTVTPNQSLEDQIKTNLIPGGAAGSRAKLYLEGPDVFPETSHMVALDGWEQYGITDVEVQGSGFVLEFDTIDENEIREYLKNLDGFFDEVVSEIGEHSDF